jgi:hypothetical protein
MEQSPSWEVNRFVASQEIPRVLLNPKVHYQIYNCPPPVSILSQHNPVHTPTSHFLKIHPNIIFHLRLRLPIGLFPSGVPTKTLYTPLSSPSALHAPPSSFFSILSPAQYWLRSTLQKLLQCKVIENYIQLSRLLVSWVKVNLVVFERIMTECFDEKLTILGTRERKEVE